MDFLRYRKFYFLFSALLITASIALLFSFGLNLGIEFTGGSSLEGQYSHDRPSLPELREKLSEFDFQTRVQLVGDKGVLVSVQEKEVSKDLQSDIVNKLEELGEFEAETKGFESISGVIGKELRQKTNRIIFFSLLAILIYITFAFRRISRPVPSWQYGIATIIALFHDVIIPVGVFAVLGKYYGVPITIPIVTALLTVFGYSVNDTVVVFDRVRENLLKGKGVDYVSTVNHALNDTLTRSINTSLTTLFVLLAIFFLGGETLKFFALALILGILCGTYSSIFLASPLLVFWRLRRMKK